MHTCRQDDLEGEGSNWEQVAELDAAMLKVTDPLHVDHILRWLPVV